MPMVGSPLVGAWIAQIAFWLLLPLGVASGAFAARTAAIFAALWILGYVVIPRLAWWASPLVTSYVAVLDIVLVFWVFKGDVRF